MSNPSPSKRRKIIQTNALPTQKLPTHAKSSPKQAEEPEDWTSSSGSDTTSDSESDSNAENAPITITTAPNSIQPIPSKPDTTIHTRLTSFFSQLAEQRANPESDTGTSTDRKVEKFEINSDSDADSGFEDEDGERGQYIELDLALGVLSEKESDDEGEGKGPEIKVRMSTPEREENESSEDGDRDENGDDLGLAELTNVAAGGGNRIERRRGQRKGSGKSKIQEVD